MNVQNMHQVIAANNYAGAAKVRALGAVQKSLRNRRNMLGLSNRATRANYAELDRAIADLGDLIDAAVDAM